MTKSINLEVPYCEQICLVGTMCSNIVTYSIVDNDVEFINSGLSIIHLLRTNKVNFVSLINESQAYDSIKYIFDDKIVFSKFNDLRNENKELISEILTLSASCNDYEYFYIYDLDADVLLLKTPELDDIIALDYNNSADVRDIINRIKG